MAEAAAVAVAGKFPPTCLSNSRVAFQNDVLAFKLNLKLQAAMIQQQQSFPYIKSSKRRTR